MFWDRETETMKRPQLEALQLKRLQATVRRVVQKVPLYQQRFAEWGLKPRHIQSLADVRRLPFTTPADLTLSFIELTTAPSGSPDVLNERTAL